MLTRNEWRATIGLAGIYATRMFGLFAILPVAALYIDRMPGATVASLGLAIGIYGLVQAALQWPFGWVSDRLGRRPVMAVGLVLFIAGSVVAAMAETVWGVMAGRALQGAGAISGVVLALSTELVDEERRPRALAVIGLTIGLTFSGSLLVAPWLDAHFGLAGIFWLSAALGVVALLWLWWLVPEPSGTAGTLFAVDALSADSPTDSPAVDARRTVSVAGGHEQSGAASPPCLGWRRKLNGLAQMRRCTAATQGPLVGTMLGALVLHAILAAVFLLVPGWWRELGVESAMQGWLYLPVLLVSFVLMLPFVVLGERFGWVRGVLRTAIGLLAVSLALSLAVLLGVGSFEALSASSVAGSALSMWPRPVVIFMLGLMVFFVAFNVLEACLPALVAKRASVVGRGAAMGRFATAQFLGIFAGGAGGGWLLSAYGPTALLAVLLVVTVLWWLGAWIMPPVARMRTEAIRLRWRDGFAPSGPMPPPDVRELARAVQTWPGVEGAWLQGGRSESHGRVAQQAMADSCVPFGWVLWLRFDASRVDRDGLRRRVAELVGPPNDRVSGRIDGDSDENRCVAPLARIEGVAAASSLARR